MGELKVVCQTYKTGTGSTSHKYAVDATATRSNQLNVELVNPESGAPVDFGGRRVFVSSRGDELLRQWQRENNMPDGFKMIVKEDSISDWLIYGYNEQA